MAMEYNRNALISVFREMLLGYGYETPDNGDSLGYLHIDNEDFKLLPSLDNKVLVIAATYDWTFCDYDFDDMPDGIIGDNIKFDTDEAEQVIRFIATVNFDDINEDNLVSKVGGTANAISAAYDSLCEDVEYMEWKQDYDFTPVTYSEFECPVCGNHIAYTPGTCPNCGEDYDADSEDIECGFCGSVLDEIVCPTCKAHLRQWDIEQYIQLSDAEREKLTKLHRINYSLEDR